MWKTLISLAIWGPGWGGGGFKSNQTGPILVHIYPLFILIYMPNIEAIYDKNLLNFKIKNISGPYKKSRVSGHRNVSKCSPHQETYVK